MSLTVSIPKSIDNLKLVKLTKFCKDQGFHLELSDKSIGTGIAGAIDVVPELKKIILWEFMLRGSIHITSLVVGSTIARLKNIDRRQLITDLENILNEK